MGNLKTINLTHAMQRIAKVTPNTPPEAVAGLRQGFSLMMKDQKFIQDSKKSLAPIRTSK
jgi:hypothetical protein